MLPKPLGLHEGTSACCVGTGNCGSGLHSHKLMFSCTLTIDRRGTSNNGVIATPAYKSYKIIPTMLCRLRGDHSFDSVQVLETLTATKLVKGVMGRGTSVSKTRTNYRTRMKITYSVTSTTTDRLFKNDPTRVRCTTRVNLRRRLKVAYSPMYKLMRVPYVREGTCTTTQTLSTGVCSTFASNGRHMSFSGIIRMVGRANRSLPSLCGRADRNNLTGSCRPVSWWRNGSQRLCLWCVEK